MNIIILKANFNMADNENLTHTRSAMKTGD